MLSRSSPFASAETTILDETPNGSRPSSGKAAAPTTPAREPAASPLTGKKGKPCGVSLEATRNQYLARNGGAGKGSTMAFKFTNEREKKEAQKKAEAWVKANAL